MKKYAIVVFLILFSRAASAYTRITISSGQSPRWSSMPVSYWINEKGSPQISNGSEFAAVRASFQTWQNIQNANIQFSYQGTTPAVNVGLDGMNIVTFSDTAAPLGSSTIAATFSYFKTDGGDLLFRESDIAVNPALAFSTSGENGKFDIQSVVTHEVGHLLGLDHCGLVSSVMVPFGVPSQLDQRTLAYDDIAGAMEIYPNPSSAPATGRIEGTVLSGTGPVFGAHVVAVDSNGTAVTSTISQRDGSYALRYLPPDRYRIFAEPLDGPVTVQNFLGGSSSGGFYSGLNSNFGTAYFGNTFTLDQAAFVEVGPGVAAAADIQVFPASASGLNLTRPSYGLRVSRGQTLPLSNIGGVDITDGVIFSASSSDLQFSAWTFGGRLNSSALTSASAQLTVLPAAAPGPKLLAVNRGTDLSIVAGAFVITNESPSDIAVVPSSGASDGNTSVVIQGAGFRPGAQVYFGGLLSSDVQLLDGNTLRATVPANIPGPANVVVFNSDGTWGVGIQSFSYSSQPPSISSVTPASGVPGTAVVIRGDHFDSRAQNLLVQFNGVSAPVIAAGVNSITALVPFGATTGPLSVTVFGQTAPGPTFTVLSTPSSTNPAPSGAGFIDAGGSAGGTVLIFNDNDDAIVPVTLPFDFVLFRDIYTAGSTISVAINGYLSLTGLSLDEFANASLPATTVRRSDGSTGTVPPALIAPFWDDLIMHPNSSISTRTMGTVPNRQFVIEWANMSVLDENGQDLNAGLTFEAVLYEGSNDIQFVYGPMSGPRSDGSTATVGAQNLKRDTAVQAGFSQPVVSTGTVKTYHFQNGNYVTDVPEADVKIIPAAPQNNTEFSGIAFLAPVAMSVVLKAIDANGALISGPGITNPATITLSAGQQYARLVSELFGAASFDGWIEADASAAGLGVFIATGSWDMQHMDGFVVRDPAKDLVLFHPGASAILVNPSSRTASVMLTELGSGRSESLSIPSGSRVVRTLTGAMLVHSSEPLAAVERSNGPGSLAINAAAAVAEAQPALVFPEAVVGGGYASTLTVANLGQTQQTVLVTFGGSQAYVKLDSNAVVQQSLAELLNLPANVTNAGALSVTGASPGSTPALVGVLDLQNPTDAATISALPAAADFMFPNVDNRNGFFTGLAIATGNAATGITVDVYPAGGGSALSAVVNLDANQQSGRLLTEIVPGSVAQLGGYIHVHADHPVWAWGIYGSNLTIASIPPL